MEEITLFSALSRFVDQQKETEEEYLKQCIANVINNSKEEITDAILVFVATPKLETYELYDMRTLVRTSEKYTLSLPCGTEEEREEVESRVHHPYRQNINHVLTIYPEQLTDIKNNAEKYEMEDYL